MISLLLLAAHMVGDYVTQTNWMAARKLVDWRVRSVHVLIYTLGFVPIMRFEKLPTGSAGLFLLSVFLTHFITDCRRWASGDQWPPKPILVDQTIHLATLAILGALFHL